MINSILEKTAQSFRIPKYRDVLERQICFFLSLLRVQCEFCIIFWIGIQFNETKKKYRICYGIRYPVFVFLFPLIYQPFPFDLISSMVAHWYRFILRALGNKNIRFRSVRGRRGDGDESYLTPSSGILIWQEMFWPCGIMCSAMEILAHTRKWHRAAKA